MRNVLVLSGNATRRTRLRDMFMSVTNGECMVYFADDMKQGRREAASHPIDLFVIEIQLDHRNIYDLDGFNFAEELRSMEFYRYTPMIFLAKDRVEKLFAFMRFHCYDILELPIDEARYMQCFSKALELASVVRVPRTFYFCYEEKRICLKIDEIVCAICKDRKLEVFTEKERFSFYYVSLSGVLKELPCERFVQCSRNAFFNLSYLDYLDVSNNEIHLRGDYPPLKVGEQYKKGVKLLLR
ncbi:MAG: LytTR family transcriptional regulator DNA-binding domain-containing protein [Lachnospiraceae bacterium]|nr:LytTR family transcriptional regulator DNA-binding domain-containing protein [Lachnospiraceae bacterium]